MKDFQSLLFSSKLDTKTIQIKINELKNTFSAKEIDHQIILAFSLNYEKIAILGQFLLEPKIKENDFIHYDQELLYHLLKNNISFPLSIIANFRILSQPLYNPKFLADKNYFIIKLEKTLYEELKKLNKLAFFEDFSIEMREKTKIEEIIEKDDIDSFRFISNETNFDFNRRLTKNNQLFKYSEIPIISYCIEKNSIKCFKYSLINGADPSKKSFDNYKEMWDGYGFAGAIGNIQLIKMIQDQGIKISKNVIEGSSKFHQNHIIQWIAKDYCYLMHDGLKNCLKYDNIEGFDIINNNCNILAKEGSKKMYPCKTILHYATKYNLKEIVETLILKGADINAIDIIYQIIIN